MPMRRLALAIALVSSLAVVATASADVIIIGAQPPADIRPPKPHSTAGMKMVLAKKVVSAGQSFAAAAGYFKSGEYVTVWDFFAGNRRVGWLNGGNASARGVLELQRDTVSVTAQGRHVLCARGERSKRVACATYVVKGGALTTGPGYEPPTTGGWQPPQVGPGYEPPGSNP